MLAWMAGIQARRMPGDIYVNLGFQHSMLERPNRGVFLD
jgi:hypothetical protein